MIYRGICIAIILTSALALAAEPFPIGGGWSTCGNGYLISIDGTRCFEPVRGPIVEYGCEIKIDRNDIVTQSCPSARLDWTGNIGNVGAPFLSIAPSQSFGFAVFGSGR